MSAPVDTDFGLRLVAHFPTVQSRALRTAAEPTTGAAAVVLGASTTTSVAIMATPALLRLMFQVVLAPLALPRQCLEQRGGSGCGVTSAGRR